MANILQVGLVVHVDKAVNRKDDFRRCSTAILSATFISLLFESTVWFS